MLRATTPELVVEHARATRQIPSTWKAARDSHEGRQDRRGGSRAAPGRLHGDPRRSDTTSSPRPTEPRPRSSAQPTYARAHRSIARTTADAWARHPAGSQTMRQVAQRLRRTRPCSPTTPFHAMEQRRPAALDERYRQVSRVRLSDPHGSHSSSPPPRAALAPFSALRKG